MKVNEHIEKAEHLLEDISEKVQQGKANIDVSMATAQEATAHALLALV
jgi:hypothetical protein